MNRKINAYGCSPIRIKNGKVVPNKTNYGRCGFCTREMTDDDYLIHIDGSCKNKSKNRKQ